MNKLFIIERTDSIGWDEYISVLVSANDKFHAIRIANELNTRFKINVVKTKFIGTTNEPYGVLMDSFLNG
ncbi:hypothetical protein BPT24_240 [Tenacibaculum phage pT24]|uniref:Uncharacterized protein n=1 Tax=Tenacibaculum phage pT24 TaxID=1880590 RepID=A0A1B4XX27_9CAUD|nr:hypothetical protein HYP10_gp288 [Tenacibaculum phage pT24]BAV39360.1 hypothetical protein BPT24_240 [Tenacibaculum phage pT24]